MIKSGEKLFYINSVGAVFDAVAVGDERIGAVAIEVAYKDGRRESFDIGTLHVCRTLRAAQIVAGQRAPVKQ